MAKFYAVDKIDLGYDSPITYYFDSKKTAESYSKKNYGAK